MDHARSRLTAGILLPADIPADLPADIPADPPADPSGGPSEGSPAAPPVRPGTVRINGVALEDVPAHQPHPGCAVTVVFSGFKPGTAVTVAITAHPPTGAGELLASAGTTLADGSGQLSFDLTGALDGRPAHPRHGHHVAFTVDGDAGPKHKVFWVDCPTAAAPPDPDSDPDPGPEPDPEPDAGPDAGPPGPTDETGLSDGTGDEETTAGTSPVPEPGAPQEPQAPDDATEVAPDHETEPAPGPVPEPDIAAEPGPEPGDTPTSERGGGALPPPPWTLSQSPDRCTRRRVSRRGRPRPPCRESWLRGR